MPRTFLVTGAAGFTGQHLCRLLREKNYKIVAVNRSPAKNVQRCDLSSSAGVLGLLKRVRPNGIFHCAGSFSNDWKRDFNANVLLTQKLLEAVKNSSQKIRILLIGSAAEYGIPKKKKISEQEPLKPVSIYGLSKKMQTVMMEYYVRQFGMDIVMARTFNLFGPGCSSELLPGRVMSQAKEVVLGKRKKIKISSIDSSRDYLHIKRAVEAYLQIMQKGIKGEIYNVGSGNATKLKALLKKIIKTYNLSFKNILVDKKTYRKKVNVPCVISNQQKLRKITHKLKTTNS
jgi:GDP-4-dehydro-6-deoxy-D-mannose reductase